MPQKTMSPYGKIRNALLLGGFIPPGECVEIF